MLEIFFFGKVVEEMIKFVFLFFLYEVLGQSWIRRGIKFRGYSGYF